VTSAIDLTHEKILDYRESWHKKVCSEELEGANHAPWEKHSDCDLHLEDISTVY
jgi:hypothetical protein